MKKIVLGKSALEISSIIFGGNVFGWTLDESASFRILDAFVDLGFNSIDTANNYSHWVAQNKGGESEEIIGAWQKSRGNRDKVVLMTKVGGRFSYADKPNTKGDYIIAEVENSLRRLKTDYIDLYQTHYDDEITPVEETLRAYDSLIKAGKVRYIGASNIAPERLMESLICSREKNLPAYISLQPEYNLFDRQKFEQLYMTIGQEEGLGVIPYYALASGFLSGKYQEEADFEKYPRGEGIKKKYWNARGQRIVKELKVLAEARHTSMSAVALAWLLGKNYIAAPIASATKEAHLQAFVDAVEMSLTSAEMDALDFVSQ